MAGAALLCLAVLAVLALGQVATARQRAAGAADLAALAAADRLPGDPSRACDLAREVAAAQRARVVRCVADGRLGEVADLTAEARAGPYRVRARARAGPAAG